MTNNIDDVRKTFDGAEDVQPLESPETSKKIASGSSLIEGGDAMLDLPDDPPLLPLGQADGKFYFLTARDEMANLSAGALAQRANLVALVSGADNGIEWLGEVAPPSQRDVGFNPSGVADALMSACSALPLFDEKMPIRHWGTWRGSGSNLIVHLGENVECPECEERRGRMIARALYPAVPASGAPSDKPASKEDIKWLGDRLDRFWTWRGDVASSDVIIGWVGQAALGHFPVWRTHMWIKGKNGSGKSTLLRIISLMLGGMSSGVKKSTSAAAIRQTTNRQAIARIFDEAEADGSGRMEEVISLFRLMSDADGAQFERGTADHSGVRFALYGAGLMASIIPGSMSPQDRSRFVTLDLAERKSNLDPETAAGCLADLEGDAKELGNAIWRRMLDLAPKRWDHTFRFYSALIEGLGARSRDAATIGAVLAGWDLMMFDTIVSEHHDDKTRIARAREIAEPLMRDAQVAEEEGEGERCLRHILGTMLHKEHGGVVTASELIDTMQESTDKPDVYSQKLLGRIGLRVMDGKSRERNLFVANAENPMLNKALGGTRWRGGGHRAALDTLEGVVASGSPVRIIGGKSSRGVIVPSRHLPGFMAEKPDNGAEYEL